MNSKQKATLRAIFEKPSRSDIKWSDIVSLFKALGAEEIKTKGKTGGSRRKYKLGGFKGLFHRPHPGDVVDKGFADSVSQFLERAGIKP